MADEVSVPLTFTVFDEIPPWRTGGGNARQRRVRRRAWERDQLKRIDRWLRGGKLRMAMYIADRPIATIGPSAPWREVKS